MTPRRSRFGSRSTARVVTTNLPETLARRVVESVDEGVERRWEPARLRAGKIEGVDIEQRVSIATASFRREIGAAGAAAGGTAALPGVGTAASAATVVVELGWSTIRLTDLILTIAALHGHRSASVEERRMWVLSVMAYGGSASAAVSRLASEMGLGLGRHAAGSIPADNLRQLNRTLAAHLVTRYGARRGAVAIGRLVPFGIGAALGYGLNSYTVKATARHADEFFAKMPHRPDDVIEAQVSG